jgi:molybdate-binding protein
MHDGAAEGTRKLYDRALKQRELNKNYIEGFQGHWKTQVNNRRKNTREKALQ